MAKISSPSSANSAKTSFLHLLVLLGCFFSSVNGIKCGTPLTTDCLGDTDIRYDPEASNNAEDQAAIWKKTAGLFVGEGTVRISFVEPFVGNIPSVSDPSAFIVTLPFYEFVNRTNIGSRRFSYSYYMVPSSPIMPRVTRNVFFTTTTYEKDGSLVIPFVGSVTDNSDPEQNGVIPTARRTYAVDENTEYYSVVLTSDLVDGVINAIRICLDVDCNRYDGSTNIYSIVNDTTRRVYADEWAFARVETAEEWYQAIYDRYNESNIPLAERLDPTIDICDIGLCPTEEQWCETDPDCSDSPYQEPPASVRGGVIAGFTIAGVIILVGVLYLVHRYLLARQAQRYRTVFAKRIADTIEVRGSMRALPPDALVEEFNRIDADVKDGKLSKEEMWEFISSGKAGEMDRKDFDALFVAIDLDGNGNVDFLEFCSFMGKCHDEYRTARLDRGSVVARSSRRLMVFGTTARRLSEASMALLKVPEDEMLEVGETMSGLVSSGVSENISYRRQSDGLQSMPSSRSQGAGSVGASSRSEDISGDEAKRGGDEGV